MHWRTVGICEILKKSARAQNCDVCFKIFTNSNCTLMHLETGKIMLLTWFFFIQCKLRWYCFESYDLGPPIWGPGTGMVLRKPNYAKMSDFFICFQRFWKLKLTQGPQIACAHFMSSGMFRAIAGIKNEVKSTIRSFYSYMGSALVKILKKVLGHPIFWGPIWIQNDSKTGFFSHRQA